MTPRMVLELTSEQIAFRESVEQFARETVAPRAAAIDESGEFSLDVVRAAARRGLLGATIPKGWGGAGLDYLSYVMAIEAIAGASATVAVSLVVHNSLVAEVNRACGWSAPQGAVAAKAGRGRGDWRVRPVGTRRRHRRGEPEDKGHQKEHRISADRSQSLDGECGRRVGRGSVCV